MAPGQLVFSSVPSGVGGALVVWFGDDDVGDLVPEEVEVFGQRLGEISIFSDGFESGGLSTWH